jgi:uncharacterized protein YukE
MLGGAIDGLLSIPSSIEDFRSQVMGQHKAVASVQGMAKKTVQAVNGSWVGGDSEAYQNAITSQLVPAIEQLLAAIMNLGGNLGQGINIMQTADQMVGKAGDELNSIFQKIVS